MPYLLQVDFPMPGPFGAAMVQAFTELAHSINQEPGMRWKSGRKTPRPKRLAACTCSTRRNRRRRI